MPKRITLIALLIGILIITSAASADGLEAVFVDVGSADSAVFICDGEAMMVDTGQRKESFEHIKDILDDYGVTSLKYLVLTHPHADHIGNAGRIVKNYNVDHVILPPIEHDTKVYDDLISLFDEIGIDKQYPQVGESFTLGSAGITIYGPHSVAYSNLNDWSIVMMIEFAGRSVLMTGDIEAEAEGDLLAYNDKHPLSADVLKVAHHGSDSSSTYPFIQAVSPKFAVVSCSSTEKREYPHVETAMTLVECGVEDILTTEVMGDIRLSVTETGELSIESLSKLDNAA